MAVIVLSLYITNCHECRNPNIISLQNRNFIITNKQFNLRKNLVLNKLKANSDQNNPIQADEANKDDDDNSLGVKAALSMLKFYKRELSPLIPKSCRFVPTCSEYSMEAYKTYGVVKGTALTAWRLCRCNPLGGSGFDPPRWFDEKPPTIEEEEE